MLYFYGVVNTWLSTKKHLNGQLTRSPKVFQKTKFYKLPKNYNLRIGLHLRCNTLAKIKCGTLLSYLNPFAYSPVLFNSGLFSLFKSFIVFFGTHNIITPTFIKTDKLPPRQLRTIKLV